MFAKITSQVREQCKCLLIILLILQTVPVSFLLLTAFPDSLKKKGTRVWVYFTAAFQIPLDGAVMKP